MAFLGLSAASSLIDNNISKRVHGGRTTLLFLDEDINDIMKIVQAPEDSDILVKGVTKTIKNNIKNQSGSGIGLLAGLLGSTISSSLISGKGISRTDEAIYRSGKGTKRTGQGISKKGQGYLRAGQGIKKSSNFTSTSFNKL